MDLPTPLYALERPPVPARMLLNAMEKRNHGCRPMCSDLNFSARDWALSTRTRKEQRTDSRWLFCGATDIQTNHARKSRPYSSQQPRR
jgi:hypothetical protein